jgi:DNA invertase Pin-like site-specific DNA recombinase
MAAPRPSVIVIRELVPGVPGKLGYARVSTEGQNDDTQVADLTAYGCDVIYIDHGVSGKHASRPQLDAALAALRPGDVFVITRLSRAMRSIHQLLDMVNGTAAANRQDGFKARGIDLVVIRQQIDTTTKEGRLMFHLMAAFDEYLRELIVEGTKEGLAVARANGKRLGAKPKVTPKDELTIRRLKAGGSGVDEIAETVELSRATVYRVLAAQRAE